MPPLDSNLNKNQLAVDFPIQIIKHFAVRRTHCPAYAGNINAKTNITMATTTRTAANAATSENNNAANAASENNHGAEKVKIVVDRVNLVEQDGTSTVYINFDTPIRGHAKTSEGRIETDVKYFSMATYYFLEQLRDANKLLKRFINAQEHMTKEILNYLLTDAEMTVLRTWRAAGEEVTDDDGKISVYDHDWFETQVIAVKLDEMSVDYIKSKQ